MILVKESYEVMKFHVNTSDQRYDKPDDPVKEIIKFVTLLLWLTHCKTPQKLVQPVERDG